MSMISGLILALVLQQAPERPAEWATPIAMPGLPNLHQVDTGIYRSAQPEAGAQASLSALGVRSVISLRYSEDDPALLPNVQRIHAPIESWDVDHDEIMLALKSLIDPDNQPVLLHCRHGADRTGTVMASYRMVVQGWSADAAITEMREGGYNYHAIWRNMIRYLERLDVTAARAELGLSGPAPTTAPSINASTTPLVPSGKH
ncbi:protein-tyrosine-phosphatase [Ahniella affigens]|uniref:Protein-tyrosine-phosphatase n=1 Tax=Ahniella affigens TaxID=2021234 RepID=A0A2P1PXT6_9GAMM|nr:tyrosine-protein phosphatase [Ahniella affigens]AVP99656.1 protein-tyrosine-phosphatase [Ahniella affigens]